MIKQSRAGVVSNNRIGEEYYRMVLHVSGFDGTPLPGQFVHVRISDRYPPLLRRPFSILKVQGKSSIELLYKVVGTGTRFLSGMKKGQSLDIIGPCGNGYSIPDKGGNVLLAGGGTGIVSLVFLAERLARDRDFSTHVIIGAKEKTGILCENDFSKAGCRVSVATEDGSRGFEGRVTELLDELSSEVSPAVIYACGPGPMLKEVARISARRRIPCQVSLEERMACGIGACMGCAVKTRTGGNGMGYRRVCADGPVFGSGEIIWD